MTSGKFCPVSTCITGKGSVAGRKAFSANRSSTIESIACREQQHRTRELGDHFPDDVHRLCLEQSELVDPPGVGRARHVGRRSRSASAR